MGVNVRNYIIEGIRLSALPKHLTENHMMIFMIRFTQLLKVRLLLLIQMMIILLVK